MHIAVVGLGTTGSQVARQLRPPDVAQVTLFDLDQERIAPVRGSLDDRMEITTGLPSSSAPPDVTILASPAGTHYELARKMLVAGSHVVSISDDPEEVQRLLKLDSLAVAQRRSVVVGAGFCPGLSEILARWSGDKLDQVDGVSVSTSGTGGPACARRLHRALKSEAYDWRDGVWEYRRGGSGRDLAWFPDPIGARDCYFAALASPLLLQRTYPDAKRISARLSANRRHRLTGRLPMLRPPHRDGGPGGIRVEVRGSKQGSIETLVYGVMDFPSVAAGTVSAVAALAAGREQAPIGAHGLSRWDDPATLLTELHNRGVQVASFSGPVVPKA